MTHEELAEAWLAVCSTSEEGDFTVSRKKGKWEVKVTTYMDATLAHKIMSFMTASDDEKPNDWHPDMFREET